MRICWLSEGKGLTIWQKKAGHLKNQGPAKVFAIQSGRVTCGLKTQQRQKGRTSLCVLSYLGGLIPH